MFKPDLSGADPLQYNVAAPVAIVNMLFTTAAGKVRTNRVRTELPR